MNILGKKEILKASDLKIELVAMPEWGGSIYVRGMNGAERDRFEQEWMDNKLKTKSPRAFLCALCICDEAGKGLFTEQDVAELSDKDGVALARVFDVAMRLSGLSGVEEIEKN